MKLHFTSGYHPEGDRQTEHTNQTLEQYIRVYCNYQQDNWYQLLPLGEFVYNNAPSATMKVTPFYANKGYHPNLTIHPERNLTSPRAQEFVTDLDELHQHLQENMAAAQLRYQGTTDAHRLPALDVMNTNDFGTHLVAIRWRSKGTQLFRQLCCRVIYTSKGLCW